MAATIRSAATCSRTADSRRKSRRSARDRRPLSGEATEFCIRASKAWPRRVFVYDDRAVITHRIPEARREILIFLLALLFRGTVEGIGDHECRASRAGLATERRYTAVTLPAGVLRGLRRAARGDWAALLPAAAIIVGLMSTALGYIFGSIRQICRRGQRRCVMNTEQGNQACQPSPVALDVSRAGPDVSLRERRSCRLDASTFRSPRGCLAHSFVTYGVKGSPD